MLDGRYPMSVDAKLRVTLPSTMRKEFDKTIKLLPFKDSVYGFTPEALDSWFELVFEKRGGYDPSKSSDASLMLVLRSRVTTVELDSAGRIALGKLDVNEAGTCEKLGLTGDVSIVGNGDHFEIWNAEAWAQKMADVDLDSLFFHD